LLCNLSPKVLGVFQLANLDSIFQIRETREAALKG
jgi:anti-anti-sigma regulatory factor